MKIAYASTPDVMRACLQLGFMISLADYASAGADGELAQSLILKL
jgi:hypothetical protein